MANVEAMDGVCYIVGQFGNVIFRIIIECIDGKFTTICEIKAFLDSCGDDNNPQPFLALV